MYHGRFKGSHYEAGYKYGALLRKHGHIITTSPTFEITEDMREFTRQSMPIYKEYYSEVIEEIQGMADGQETSLETLCNLLLPMYCFKPQNHCTAFAISDGENILLCKNSDFLFDIEKLYMNCLYSLNDTYAFNGNTTAFIQIEDGMNEEGLAAALTFLYPCKRKPGLNPGMLIRFILEKCRTIDEAIEALRKIPVASAQTITLADRDGKIAVVECNCENMEVVYPQKGEHFVVTANCFHSEGMKMYNPPSDVDTWRSEERYDTARNALSDASDYSIELCEDILSGKYGFICQYDRRKNTDTVWSAIYDCRNKKFYRVEGNPSRKRFKEDMRLKLE